MRLSAYETFTLFIALKNHFTTHSYDFFKYHGKVNVSSDAFMRNKTRFHFQRLCRKYDDKQMQDFIISNLLMGKTWVGELLEDDAEDVYIAYVQRKQSLSYTFSADLDRLFSRTSPVLAFKTQKGSLPPVFNALMAGDISYETFVILNDFLPFFKIFDQKMADDFLWAKYGPIAKKYRPFLDYDKEKLCRVLKEKLHDYSDEKQETSRPSVSETEEACAG